MDIHIPGSIANMLTNLILNSTLIEIIGHFQFLWKFSFDDCNLNYTY